MSIFRVCFDAAMQHIVQVFCQKVLKDMYTCGICNTANVVFSNFCSKCGTELFNSEYICESLEGLKDGEREYYENIFDKASEQGGSEIEILFRYAKMVARNIMSREKKSFDVFYPGSGIYIYYHPYEKYKIGKAVNVLNRIADHKTSARSLELLHVIETSDQDWCERFLHDKFRHKRLGGEYFDLNQDDLEWLFSIKVLEPPKNISNQLSLLDLLDNYPTGEL